MEKIYFILKFCQLFLLQQPKVEKQLRFFLIYVFIELSR